MRKKKFTKPSVPRVRRQKEPLPWKFCLATILCAAFVAAGFFFAAQQHFYSMDYGIENSRLRSQIEDLKSRNRRLKLKKEVALSPYEIKQAAMKLGLRGTTVHNLQPLGELQESMLAAVDEHDAEEAAPVRTVIRQDEKPKTPAAAVVAEKPRVVKTVKTAPSKASEPSDAKEKESAKSTRSRIIDEAARR
ncbi:MAG: hypothetical protein IPM63_00350 [Acidobacteriota bacterium]|nr:MAG: hypothetical protein IPM63_00350 [Acidobacteriota bacterium]